MEIYEKYELIEMLIHSLKTQRNQLFFNVHPVCVCFEMSIYQTYAHQMHAAISFKTFYPEVNISSISESYDQTIEHVLIPKKRLMHFCYV